MPGLYVYQVGSRLEVEHQRILVTFEDEVLFRARLDQVSHVVLMGRIGLTTPAMHDLLHREVPVFLLSSGGTLLGRLIGPRGLNIPLRKAQYQRDADDGFSFNLAKMIVEGKLRNQLTLARRWLRLKGDANHPDLDALNHLLDEVPRCLMMDSLLGIEGAAAALYFDLYQSLFDPCWEFETRNRRPPRDPINALLSLGYTLLHCNLTAALEIVGLDPYLGYYHTEQYGHPALALDLEEEFRAPVVDSLVLDLIGHHIIKAEHFDDNRDEEGVRLTDRGRRIFFQQYHRKVQSAVKTLTVERPIAYQKHFEVQARSIARWIEGKKSDYLPFRIR